MQGTEARCCSAGRLPAHFTRAWRSVPAAATCVCSASALCSAAHVSLHVLHSKQDANQRSQRSSERRQEGVQRSGGSRRGASATIQYARSARALGLRRASANTIQ